MTQPNRQLKAAAHNLKPVIIIGSHGLTTSVQTEIQVALEAHELIKIRINAADKETRQEMIEQILEEHDASLVSQIGHIAVIYRNKDSD